jgi:hypothetical protein
MFVFVDLIHVSSYVSSAKSFHRGESIGRPGDLAYRYGIGLLQFLR